MNKSHWIPQSMFYRVLWPSFVSALTLAVADIADALVVGSRMGEKGLAAIGIVTPVYMLYNLLGYGFSQGGCVTHGKLTALGEDEAALCHFRALTGRGLLVALTMAILGNVLMIPVLSVLGVDGKRPELLSLCMDYARPLLGAAPVFMLNFLLYDFVRCDNAPRLATLGFSLGCVVDLGLNILLVIVLGMGVKGSIIATITAQTVSVAVLTVHLFKGKGILRLKAVFSAKKDRTETKKHLTRSLKIGFSASFRYVFQFAFLFLANRLLLSAGDLSLIDGDLYVAVFDVVMNVSFVALALHQATAETMQPLGAAFTQEHDQNSLRYVLRLALLWGLGTGALVSGLLAGFAGAVSGFFGLTDADSLTVSIPAIRIFCLSTPFAGILIILTGFFQSSGQEKWSSLITALRSAVCLLPLTMILGIRYPAAFWWIFPICEALSVVVVLTARRLFSGKETNSVPPFSACLDNDDHELGKTLSALETYCEGQEIPVKKAMQVQLAVEELCVVIMKQAFTGKANEYIQITLAPETNGDYTLCIRNSAPRFNPFLMKMGRIQQNEEENIMDSMGVLLVKKQSKSLHYRNFEGFNVLKIVL